MKATLAILLPLAGSSLAVPSVSPRDQVSQMASCRKKYACDAKGCESQERDATQCYRNVLLNVTSCVVDVKSTNTADNVQQQCSANAVSSAAACFDGEEGEAKNKYSQALKTCVHQSYTQYIACSDVGTIPPEAPSTTAKPTDTTHTDSDENPVNTPQNSSVPTEPDDDSSTSANPAVPTESVDVNTPGINNVPKAPEIPPMIPDHQDGNQNKNKIEWKTPILKKTWEDKCENKYLDAFQEDCTKGATDACQERPINIAATCIFTRLNYHSYCEAIAIEGAVLCTEYAIFKGQSTRMFASCIEKYYPLANECEKDPGSFEESSRSPNKPGEDDNMKPSEQDMQLKEAWDETCNKKHVDEFENCRSLEKGLDCYNNSMRSTVECIADKVKPTDVNDSKHTQCKNNSVSNIVDCKEKTEKEYQGKMAVSGNYAFRSCLYKEGKAYLECTEKA
ncbi:uncharacterized protein MAM_08454 [Metarhizium album ARSEF 1941]|uniref:Uncharacterized protein n=1 Tax=Metarhizium album (strain ARSEF 1941) TaxID=1081103 RepID=A0A0B2WKY6_METAS|nr:uncharacterized protein MAM_08454 [Metarhizium album ARSEF 1941]KHN93685.1 hypothetical protein MAM_08454 [Metarhizium album ARSEF 1941]